MEEVASEDESEQPSEESKSSSDFVVLTNKESEMSAGDKSGNKQTSSSGFSVVDSRT